MTRSGAALALVWFALNSVLPAKPPNIIIFIFMADGWSRPHAGICGDKVVKAPAFDRVARAAECRLPLHPQLPPASMA